MKINDTIFNVEVIDIITELKTELAINGVELFSKYFDSGDNVMVCCPYHKGGQERRPSAGIRKSDGTLHCFQCGKVAGLDEMVANCFGQADPIWGYRWLLRNFATVKVEERSAIKLDFKRNSGVSDSPIDDVFVSEEELDSYRYSHKYMYERGLNANVIEQFDIGYDRDTDSITFPVRYWDGDKFGKTIFIARRQIKTKRFDLPKDKQKPLYGLYEIWADIGEKTKYSGIKNVNAIYVCEGLFDCLRLWCNGKYAVAGFGCLFSDYQIELLRGLPTRHLVLALDNDKAGREATKRLRSVIKNKVITEVVLPRGKKDIGECSDEEIQNLEEVF